MDCVDVERIVHLDSHWQQLIESRCESSVGNNMGPKQSSKSLHLQKAALRHRMTRADYELIVDYLEIEEHFLAITRGGRKTKVGGRNLTKRTEFGHMAVSLCAQGFPPCDGTMMGKKFNRYLETCKKPRPFYTGTGAGLTEEDLAAGLTIEAKMNFQCPFFSRMHSLYGSRANVDPHALGDANSLEIERRARAARRSQLLAAMLKGGKTLDEVKAAFELLECVEQKISGSMM
ncbi:hypothetical protein R1sor_012038 [Riccia sorocarpa]|uniref:Uncharacterized protein n=1 Tax=Riccia sorocarpa TaxID=122646 RepID=A0ABD3I6K6_9MARC